jgi:hypothetical protein
VRQPGASRVRPAPPRTCCWHVKRLSGATLVQAPAFWRGFCAAWGGGAEEQQQQRRRQLSAASGRRTRVRMCVRCALQPAQAPAPSRTHHVEGLPTLSDPGAALCAAQRRRQRERPECVRVSASPTRANKLRGPSKSPTNEHAPCWSGCQRLRGTEGNAQQQQRHLIHGRVLGAKCSAVDVARRLRGVREVDVEALWRGGGRRGQMQPC